MSKWINNNKQPKKSGKYLVWFLGDIRGGSPVIATWNDYVKNWCVYDSYDYGFKVLYWKKIKAPTKKISINIFKYKESKGILSYYVDRKWLYTLKKFNK